MPLPPPPSDTHAQPPGKPDTGADERMRAHMIGAPGAGTPPERPMLARLGQWLRQRLFGRP